MKMKKVLVMFIFALSPILFISCSKVLSNESSTTITTVETTFFADETIDCIPGYSWSRVEDTCKLNTDAVTFDDDPYITYKIQYEGDDYIVYRTYVFIGDDTGVVVDMGDYNGFHYYFSSDSYYNYYLVEKDDIYKKLNEAIDSGWFSLEDVVTLFNISQLESEEVV